LIVFAGKTAVLILLKEEQEMRECRPGYDFWETLNDAVVDDHLATLELIDRTRIHNKRPH
jgi:hypothetical protein